MNCHICNTKLAKNHIGTCKKCKTAVAVDNKPVSEEIILKQMSCYYCKAFFYSYEGAAILTNKRFVFFQRGFSSWDFLYIMLGYLISKLLIKEHGIGKILIEIPIKYIKNVEVINEWHKKKTIIITTKEHEKYTIATDKPDKWAEAIKSAIEATRAAYSY